MSKGRLILAVLLVAAAAAVATLGLSSASAAPESESEPALEEFIPSEELPSDSAVAFPTDI